MRHRTRVLGALGVSGALLLALLGPVGASSHREAPLISQDPVADNTDVYAFVSPDRPDTVTLIGNWVPFEEPAGGPNFTRFGDDVLYEFNVDNNGDAVQDVTFQALFHTNVVNSGSFLYNTGPIVGDGKGGLTNQNVIQTYDLYMIRHGVRTTLATGLSTPPVNIGPRSTPKYDAIAASTVHTLPNGMKVFAGQRDDPFFVDLGSVFDLLGLRPLNDLHAIPLPKGPGKDDLSGYNTHTIALQVPKSMLVEGDPVIGVWSQTYRRQIRVFQDGNADNVVQSGFWVAVSRLGSPLVNEVVIPLAGKDRFNTSRPSQDGQFLFYVFNPEPTKLIPALYGAAFPHGAADLPPAPRFDLVSVFLTGIPGVNRPANVHAAEMLRLNTSIAPTTDPTKFSSLGVLGGDLAGFPNGRRLQDDVVDIEVRALAGGYPLTPSFNHAPNNVLTDGVDANDVPFLTTFPYVAIPHAGYDRVHQN